MSDWIEDLNARLGRVKARTKERDRDAAHVYAAWWAGVCIEPDCPYHQPRTEKETESWT